MKTIIHRAENRGSADFGWLKSFHSFSFGQFHDLTKQNFGALRVLNDDEVAGGQGFGTHPHDNMEIVSIPLSGALEHQDSLGNGKIIRTGEVQIMSAGTGVQHAEYNASKTEAVQFLQIWVFPSARDIPPRYDQKSYTHLDKQNKFITIVSPDPHDKDAVHINQQAWFSLADIEQAKRIPYTLHGAQQGVYLLVLEGQVEIGGQTLNKRDAIGLSDLDQVEIIAAKDAQVLLIEVPMQF